MAKKRKPKKAALKKPKGPPAHMTPNGKMIWTFMQESKIKGNYKDHVLFVGDRMLDQYGSYNLTRTSGETAGAPSSAISLVHKSKLGVVLGEEQGARFWDPKHKCRTNHGLKQHMAGRSARRSE